MGDAAASGSYGSYGELLRRADLGDRPDLGDRRCGGVEGESEAERAIGGRRKIKRAHFDFVQSVYGKPPIPYVGTSQEKHHGLRR